MPDLTAPNTTTPATSPATAAPVYGVDFGDDPPYAFDPTAIDGMDDDDDTDGDTDGDSDSETLRRAVHTFRMTCRRLRRLSLRGNPLAHGSAALRNVRDRAYTVVAAYSSALGATLLSEDIMMRQLGGLSRLNANTAPTRAALAGLSRDRRAEIARLTA